MWHLASAPIDVTTQSGGNLWTFLGILAFALLSLAGTLLTARRGRTRQVKAVTRAVTPAVESATNESMAELRKMYQHDFIAPLEAELEEQRKRARVAQQEQAKAERARLRAEQAAQQIADAKLRDSERLQAQIEALKFEIRQLKAPHDGP